MKSEHVASGARVQGAESIDAAEGPDVIDLEHRPEAVLSVLEEDQLVAAKQQPRFGQAQLSAGARALLWGLRIYVIAMFILVVIQVLNAVRGGH